MVDGQGERRRMASLATVVALGAAVGLLLTFAVLVPRTARRSPRPASRLGRGRGAGDASPGDRVGRSRPPTRIASVSGFSHSMSVTA